jgi:hypothetical protein
VHAWNPPVNFSPPGIPGRIFTVFGLLVMRYSFRKKNRGISITISLHPQKIRLIKTPHAVKECSEWGTLIGSFSLLIASGQTSPIERMGSHLSLKRMISAIHLRAIHSVRFFRISFRIAMSEWLYAIPATISSFIDMKDTSALLKIFCMPESCQTGKFLGRQLSSQVLLQLR